MFSKYGKKTCFQTHSVMDWTNKHWVCDICVYYGNQKYSLLNISIVEFLKMILNFIVQFNYFTLYLDWEL